MSLTRLFYFTMLVSLLASPSVAKEELSGISAEKLLNICMEGDNDSREGVVAEMECEQYISGFLDAYIYLGKAPALCLPAPGNRPDEVRWAYTRWVYKNFNQRKNSAAKELMATLRHNFSCKK